ERLRLAHRRNLVCLLFTAVPAARGHRERAEHQRCDQREQHQRDRELDQREARVARAWGHTLAPPGRPKARIAPPRGAAQRPKSQMRPQAWGHTLHRASFAAIRVVARATVRLPPLAPGNATSTLTR